MIRVKPVLFCLMILTMTGCQTNPVQKELADTYFNLGNAYLEMDRLADAESAYARAFELNPDLYVAGYNLARVHVFSGNYRSAISLLQDLLASDPENVVLKENLCWVYLETGRTDEAEILYRQLLETDPANCNVRYNLGLLLAEQEEWQQVYELLLECVYLESADGDILSLLAKSERMAEKGSGTGWLEEALSSDPGNIRLLDELAEAYTAESRYSEAMNTYDAILDQDPPSIGTYLFKMARLSYTAMENVDEGMIFLERALKSGFRNVEEIGRLLMDIGYEPDLVRFAEIEGLLKNIELYDSVMLQMDEPLTE